jgi:hypothetical protein
MLHDFVMRFSLFIFSLIFYSCASVIPKRYCQHLDTKAKVQNASELSYYIELFEREINAGNEIDLVIEVNGMSDIQKSLLFKTITEKAKSHRFIGAIQLNKVIQHSPEQSPMTCDIIKFHVHNKNNEGLSANSNFDGLSSLQVVFLRDSDLVII